MFVRLVFDPAAGSGGAPSLRVLALLCMGSNGRRGLRGGNGGVVLVFSLLAAEGSWEEKWVDSHSQSWSAVRDREIRALLLMLIAGWETSCFLQQGNIIREIIRRGDRKQTVLVATLRVSTQR